MATGGSDEAVGINFRLSDVIDVIENDLRNEEEGLPPVDESMNMQPNAQQGGLASDAIGVQEVPPGTCIQIVEQPASQEVRFRYECEGRSAGSIPGVSSTPENKTYPAVKINGYRGRVVVVVSCVTKEAPHRPHPHKLVGKEGCKRGICTVEVNNESMTACFPNLGIQCIKRKDMVAALDEREKANVDPFKTGFSHRNHVNNIDLNVVRFCFQAFIKTSTKYVILPPVVSEPIYDKKAMSNLIICRLSHASASVLGGSEVILLCEKVTKDDIEVWIYEKNGSGDIVWEEKTDFQPQDVHKQVAIPFRLPRYKSIEIEYPVEAWIELRRPSDCATSEARPFQLTPLDSGRSAFRSKSKQSIFSSLLKNKVEPMIKEPDEKIEIVIESGVNETSDHDDKNNNIIVDVIEESNQVSSSVECNSNFSEPQPVIVGDLTKENIAEFIDKLNLDKTNTDEPTVVLNSVYKDSNANFFTGSISEVHGVDETNAGGEIEDFEIYSSMHLAMKNPIDFSNVSHAVQDTYEDVLPPRPSSESKSGVLAKLKEKDTSKEDDLSPDGVPPLPPKRVKKNAILSKTLPPVPEKHKLNFFHKLFSPKKKSKSVGGGFSRESSVGGESRKSVPEAELYFDDSTLTEAEHYALYTAVAPHANMSEFDELSFYYSPVEGFKQ